MATVDINYAAVLLSAMVGFGIGAAWYSVLFGKQWMELMNINPARLQRPEGKQKAMRGYGVMFVALLIMAYILAHFIDYVGANSVGEGITAGIWIWLGFVATVMIGSVLWEERPLKLYLINVGHYLAVLIVMGIILAVWA